MRAAASIAIAAAAACTPTHSEVDRLACDSCHASEYDTAPTIASPCTPTDHVQRGFPRTCYTCHGTAAWCPADESHDVFSIAAAPHAGWDCADCHLAITYEPPAISDPVQITCTTCHWHDRGRTDPRHLGNGDYTYAPASCVECHVRGGD